MARSTIIYNEQKPAQGKGQQIDWLDEGYYKIRSFGGGPWIPCEVFLEDGDRDPETWELLSDQWLRAEWYPKTDSVTAYSISPKYLFNRARRITKDEFKWLIALKTIKSQAV